jgi:hypothetical protein
METSGRGDIVETLLGLEREKKTGALDFRAEGVLTRIFVDRGIPVFAEAGVLGETLGHVLVREQIITDKQFAAVVRKMTDAIVDNENVRFGEVVVELGILTQQDLANALATQIEKKIIGCIPRGVGDWSFDASRDVKEVVQHAAPVRALLVDAARLLPEQRVETLLKLDTDTFPCTSQSFAKIADDYGLMDREVVALGQFDGTRTTKSLVDSGSPDTEWDALLCALVMGGSIELLPQKGAKKPPSATTPVTVSGRHRAVRLKRVPTETVKVVDKVSPARRVSLPPARNDREATLFSEDEFQSGKRLFAQGMVAQAHVQLLLAVERSPLVPLYRLYEEFVGSRVKGSFKDVAATKKIAIQMVKEDAECAFAYHVLGYIALQEGDNEAAKRFFKQAFRLDPELLDAGRQARLLEKRSGSALSPATPYREIVPMRRAAAAPPKPKNPRLVMLLVIFVVVTVGTVGIIWSVLANPGYETAPAGGAPPH